MTALQAVVESVLLTAPVTLDRSETGKMDNEYLIEFYLAEGDSAIGIVAVTVDPGDTATDAVIAVHNGYSKFVKTTDNGGRYYRTRMEGVPLAFHVDQFNHVRVV